MTYYNSYSCFFQESDRMTKKSIISCWLRTRYAVVFDMRDCKHSGCIYRVPSTTLDILCFCKRYFYYTPYFYHNALEMGVFLLNALVSDTRSKALSFVGEVRKHFCPFERKRPDSTGIITVQIARINVAVYGRRDILQMETPPATRAVTLPRCLSASFL